MQIYYTRKPKDDEDYVVRNAFTGQIFAFDKKEFKDFLKTPHIKVIGAKLKAFGIIEEEEHCSKIEALQFVSQYLKSQGFAYFDVESNRGNIYLTAVYTDVDHPDLYIPWGVTAIVDKVCYKNPHIRNVYCPSTLSLIGSRAFAMSSLHNIELNDGLRTVRNEAFAGCKNLKSVFMPPSAIDLEPGIFRDCIYLRRAELSDYLTTIPPITFYNCVSLDGITLPNSLQTIGANAFEHCLSMYNICMPPSLRYINDNAFTVCENLTTLFLPTSVEIIGKQCFCDCVNLKRVQFYENETDGLKYIGSKAFFNCVSLDTMKIPSKNCEIAISALGFVRSNANTIVNKHNFVLIGYENSPADKYAKHNKVVMAYLDNNTTSTKSLKISKP